jgi:SNF2 family DNA or RNA helicase
MRRMKTDVLHDLPAKIIADRYCQLSSLQTRLYNIFASSDAALTLERKLIDSKNNGGSNEAETKNKDSTRTETKGISLIILHHSTQYPLLWCSSKNIFSSIDAGGNSMHIFQALQYLRQLCSHPALVYHLRFRLPFPRLIDRCLSVQQLGIDTITPIICNNHQ